MVLLVQMFNQHQTTPASASRCGSEASGENSRPGTPQRIISSIARRLSSSGFSGSGSRSRTSSLSFKSSSRKMESNTAPQTAQTFDTPTPLKSKKLSSSDVSQSRPMTAPARNAAITHSPAAPLTSEKTIRGQRFSIMTSPRVIVEPPLEAVSPGVVSSSSTLSVDTDDMSTRSPSLAGDMTDSQVTTSSTSTVYEDLPEGLRLMRVAQNKGIKVIDFAFEGTKKEGTIEDWAWEGGAACKGFGIGVGGGAYNGVLKKYRPPPKETKDDDRMDIDTPITTTQPRANVARPASMIAGIGGRPLDYGPALVHHQSQPFTQNPGQARAQHQFHHQPRPQSAINLSDSKQLVSQAAFINYLNQRKPQIQEFQEKTSTIKRERSANSQEPSDCSPFKIQKRTYN